MSGPPVRLPAGGGLDPLADDRLSLVELLNRVLDRGVVLTGDALISVAGVDLLRLGVRLSLTSVETEHRLDAGDAADAS